MRKKILPGIVIAFMSAVLIFSVFALPASAATSIKKAVISISASTYTYTGKAIKPTVTVKLGKKKLSSKYYTVSYKNNKNVGKATITVKGKGSYTDSASKSFYISPKKVASFKATPYSTKVKLTWGKVTGAKGYQVYQYTDGKWTKLANTSKTSYTVSPLDSAVTYKFRVRAYSKTGSKYLYSPSYTSLSATTTIGKATTFKVSDLKETSATLSWNEVKKADEYRVTVTDEVTDKAKTYTVTAPTLSLTDLSSYRDYTVRIRAYNEEKDILGNNSDYFPFKTAPAAVKGLTATPGAQGIQLSWYLSDNISTYQVYMCTYDSEGKASDYTKLANVTGGSYMAKGIAPCTDYGFKVRAYTKTSAGYAYSEFTETDKVTVPLGKATNLVCTSKTHTTLTLSWNGVPGAAGYKLFMNGKQMPLSSATATSYTAEGLSPDTAYNFYVITHCAKEGCDKCDENSTVLSGVKTDDTRVDSIEFVTKPASVTPGKTGTVKAKVLPEYAANKNITYTSGNTSVATVNSKTGEITAIKTGETLITATSEDGGKTVSYTLTVKPITSAKISTIPKRTVAVGGTYTITPTFFPENTSNKAFTVTGADYSYSYKGGILGLQTLNDTCKLSDYISIGSNGLIRGIKATIEPQTNKAFAFTLTVKASDSGKTATIRIKVVNKSSTTTENMITLSYDTNYNPWFFGNTAPIYATFDSSISANYSATADLNWSSSNPSIATVSPEGYVTCHDVGTVTITAQSVDEAYKTSLKLYCRDALIIEKDFFDNCKVGSTYQINATLKPGKDGNNIRYVSSNDEIASVNDIGLVTFKKLGSVRILVMLSSDSNNVNEVWFTSNSFKMLPTSNQQLFNLFKEKANSVKNADVLPGFYRNDSSTFDNFTLSSSGVLGSVLNESDLYDMFSSFAMPKSLQQNPIDASSTDLWKSYINNIPVSGQYMTVLEGLDISEIKSIEITDNGSYFYDIKVVLESEEFPSLPHSAISSAHGKVFDILTDSYISTALDEINNNKESLFKVSYNSFSQKYHDSSLTISVNKATGNVHKMKYDMNIDIAISNLKMQYTIITYEADISFTCNNVVTLDFYGYKD